jgi:hypothetical protein
MFASTRSDPSISVPIAFEDFVPGILSTISLIIVNLINKVRGNSELIARKLYLRTIIVLVEIMSRQRRYNLDLKLIICREDVHSSVLLWL